jgi:hypothetical protein
MSRKSAVGYKLIIAAKAHHGIVWIVLGKIDCQGPGAESFKRIKTAPHLVSGNLLDMASD